MKFELIPKKPECYLSITRTTIGLPKAAMELLGSPTYLDFLLSEDKKKLMVRPGTETTGRKVRFNTYGGYSFRDNDLKRVLLDFVPADISPTIRFKAELQKDCLIVDMQSYYQGPSNVPIRSRKN